MSPDDGRVDHEVLVLRVGGQNLEDFFPHARSRPAGEALVDALPVAVTLRQMTPVGTAAQDPQNAVHEGPIVRSRTTSISGFAGQQILNLLPLGFGQLVSLGHIVHLTRARLHASERRKG